MLRGQPPKKKNSTGTRNPQVSTARGEQAEDVKARWQGGLVSTWAVIAASFSP